MTDSKHPFDVFLAHNTQDKPQVRIISQKLKQRNLKPWLDDEQIRPGSSFQDEIQQAIPLVKSAAVFIGSQGLGRWQNLELKTFISQCVEKKIPVIPVLLPGVSVFPEDLPFLKEFRWVAFSNIDDQEALNSLQWGITGQRTQIIPTQETFTYTVVTVNTTGKITKREQRQASYFTEALPKQLSLVMVAIPGGKFLMGSPATEAEHQEWESPQHEVTVPQFCMGKYPVTQAQWRAIASLPQVKRKMEPDPSNFKGDNLPVEQISWYEAVEFCDRLSKHTNKQYRLPSEAEWEYACRAGTTTPFSFGEAITSDLANYDANYIYGDSPKGQYREKTTSVGSFYANAFGLYDMHGNVWEWCADHWHDDYEGAPTNGSAWIDDSNHDENNNRSRLLRGGSWFNDPRHCRSAFRGRHGPDRRDLYLGFRVVVSAART